MKLEEGFSIIAMVVGLVFTCIAIAAPRMPDGSRPDVAIVLFGFVLFGIGSFYLGRYNSGGRSM